MQIKELTNEEFTEFAKNAKITSMYQSVEYALVMNKQNCSTLYYGLEEEGKITAATLLLIEKIHGFKYAEAPRGFILDYENIELLTNFTNLLKKELSKKKIIAIKINPLLTKNTLNPKNNEIIKNNKYDEIFNVLKSLGYYHFGYNDLFEGLKPRFEAIINLNKPLEDLFKAISKNFKNKIKKANFEGIKIYKGGSKDLKYLYTQAKEKYPREFDFYQDMYYYFDKNDRTDCYYAKIDTKDYLQSVQIKYQKQIEICNNANSEVFKNRGNDNNKAINKKLYEENILNTIKNELVYATNLLRDHPKGIVLATALIIKHHKTAYLFMDGYNSDYKQFSAKHLLIWKLMEKYSQEKIRKFNMGGIANFNLDFKNNPYKGLNEFRLGFGSIGYEYAGDFELKCNKLLYFIYQTLSPFHKFKKKDKKKVKEESNTDAEINDTNNKKSLLNLLFKKKENNDK